MRRTFVFGEYESTVSVRLPDRLYDELESPVLYVADSNTARFLPPGSAHVVVSPGEASKSWLGLERILSEMLALDLTRRSVLVGVGGGVVSDIVALAASLYMRGCRLVLVPTSLLGMVDAAVGGKTGINFGGYKNMVGTFYPAGEVRISTETLHTLPEREYQSGLAEVIKTAMLGNERLLGVLESEQERIASRDPELLAEIVWACVEVKGEIVQADLRESGVRAHLNLGHTFAHALESVQGLGVWSHGEAVAWGLARALELGVAASITPPEYARRIIHLLSRYGFRIDPLPEATIAVRNAMRKDKKREGDAIRFVLQSAPCETVVTAVEASVVDAVLSGQTGGSVSAG